MKYYLIKAQFYNANQSINGDANGDNIPNAAILFKKLGNGEIIENLPILDYFTLESFDKYALWESKLCDVYKFIRLAGYIGGWLISHDLKILLENFILSNPHHFYPSKLFFKNNKLDYYIFQFTGKQFRIPLTEYINFGTSIFFNPNIKKKFLVQNEQELLEQQENILINSGYKIINIQIKKLVLIEKLDFFPMQRFLGQNIVSERLKNAIEENGIEGFLFSELDYEVLVEK